MTNSARPRWTAITARLRTVAGALLGLAWLASTAQGYTLTKATVSSGAIGTAGGDHRLGATLGEAGVIGLTGGATYRLIEGFWLPRGGGVSAVAPVPVGPAAPQGESQIFATTYAANRPNPFRDGTTISFSAAEPQPITLSIYDLQGRRVRTLLQADLPAGPHQVRWDGRDDQNRPLPAGVYLSRLGIGAWSQTRPMIRMP